MGKPRKQFTFYKSYYDAIQELSKRDQSALILAVCAYAIYETPPKGLSNAASTAFKLIKPTLDSGRRKAESGALGGSAGTSKPQANRKQSTSEKEKEGEDEIEIEVEVAVEGEGNPLADRGDDYNELKMLNGTLGKGVVKLSDAQFDALLDKLGIDMFDYYVERLANFIIGSGAVVYNHFETILKWYEEDSQIK